VENLAGLVKIRNVVGSCDQGELEHGKNNLKLTALEERHFAALLVREGKDVLESCIAFPQLVPAALLGLDALLTSSLFPAIGQGLGQGLARHAGALRTEPAPVLLAIVGEILVVVGRAAPASASERGPSGVVAVVGAMYEGVGPHTCRGRPRATTALARVRMRVLIVCVAVRGSVRAGDRGRYRVLKCGRVDGGG
jgi:hypothetical protein